MERLKYCQRNESRNDFILWMLLRSQERGNHLCEEISARKSFLNVAPLTLNVREEAHKEIIKQTQSWLSFFTTTPSGRISAKGVSAVLEQPQSPFSIVALTWLSSTKSDNFVYVAFYVHDSSFPLLIKRVGSKTGNAGFGIVGFPATWLFQTHKLKTACLWKRSSSLLPSTGYCWQRVKTWGCVYN